MSKVKIQGNASGTGVVTLTAPNTNTDRTITLPDGDISLGVGIDDNATSTAITIDASENVGIGTASPTRALHVNSASGIVGTIEGSTATSFLGFNNSSLANDSTIKLGADNGNLTLYAGSTEKVRIQSGGGISFNGDTAGANALDDYEEGTFTPILYGVTTAGSPTYTTQVGYYTKVGNVVNCIIRLKTTSIGTMNGQVRIGGLPFAASSATESRSSISWGYGAGMALTAGVAPSGFLTSNSTYIRLTKWNSTAGTSYLDDAEWSADGNAMISLTYLTTP